MRPIIDPDVRFTLKEKRIKEIINFRHEHRKITQMTWVSLKPYVDNEGELVNAKTLIMLVLN